MSEFKIKLDQKGYTEYLDYIEKLRSDLNNNGKNKTSSYESAVGDGWHDNFAFEEAKRNEISLINRIEKAVSDLKNIEVIDETLRLDNTINIDDLVELNLIFKDGKTETDKFKLVGSNFPKTHDEYDEVSLNSAIGKVIYKAEIGAKVCYNTADGEKVFVEVLKKVGSSNVG